MTVGPAPRPTYYQGQYLGPEDLNAAVAYAAEHDARHALGAHTWGVAAGLAVLASQSGGPVQYWVHPGVAWDGFGRLLLVPAPVQITSGLLRTVVYDPVNDAPTGPGQLVQVWLRYREDQTAPPAAAFAACDDGGFARTIERVDIVVGSFADEPATQQLVDVGGRTVAARDAVAAWYPTPAGAPVIEDGSVAFQRFPGPTEESRWLVPIGVLRWKVAAPGSLGSIGTFEPPQPEDAALTRRNRRLVGVVAGSVLGAEGQLRLRPRALPAPTLWTGEPLWLEATTRLDGDLRLFGGPDERTHGGIDFRNAMGETAGRPIRISRHSRAAGADLRIQLGATGDADNRLTIGTESTADPPVFTDRVVVTSDGRVGIGGPADPSSAVVVHSDGDATLKLEPGPGAAAAVSTGFSDLSLRTNGVNRLTVKADGNVGVGTSVPAAPFHVSGQPADTIERHFKAHVAIIENRAVSSGADVLALRVGTPASQAGGGNNFITFFAGTRPIGRIEGHTQSGIPGISLVSGGADFAESMPSAPGEELGAGEVVAVVDGFASRATGDAAWVSVVTDRPIVLGNAPATSTAGDVAITMIGQVPVRVRGEAKPGDLLVPSGDADGTAVAYAAADIPVERAHQAFGEVVNGTAVQPDTVVALVGAHARSTALISIVQRLHADSGEPC